jgi:TPR repeat protein
MEAELTKDKLVPARLQKVAPPASFEGIQAEDLVQWDGRIDDHRVERFVAKLAERSNVALKKRGSLFEQLRQLPAVPALADPPPESMLAHPPGGAAPIGLVLPNDGRPWYDRIAAGNWTYSTTRFGVSLRDLEMLVWPRVAAKIDPAQIDSLRSAAASGDAFAQTVMHIGILGEVEGLQSDAPRAFELVRMAADQDHPAGIEQLASCYRDGASVAVDAGRAALLNLRSAEQGWAWAQVGLGASYYEGRGLPKDSARAAHLYKAAAERGHPAGETNYGMCLRDGEGVLRDAAQSVHWFQRAAAQDHPLAMNALGCSFRDGEGVPQDFDSARVWFERASESDCALGSANLAELYEEGLGVTKDLTKARTLFERALTQDDEAQDGHSIAHEGLERIGALGGS